MSGYKISGFILVRIHCISWICCFMYFDNPSKFSSLFFQFFSPGLYSVTSSSGTLMTWMLNLSLLSYRSHRCFIFSPQSFSLYCSYWIIPIVSNIILIASLAFFPFELRYSWHEISSHVSCDFCLYLWHINNEILGLFLFKFCFLWVSSNVSSILKDFAVIFRSVLRISHPVVSLGSGWRLSGSLTN